MLHNEGDKNLRNWTSYNFQTLRDDVYMLGRDGTVPASGMRRYDQLARCWSALKIRIANGYTPSNRPSRRRVQRNSFQLPFPAFGANEGNQRMRGLPHIGRG